jgi:hypothetical protein
MGGGWLRTRTGSTARPPRTASEPLCSVWLGTAAAAPAVDMDGTQRRAAQRSMQQCNAAPLVWVLSWVRVCVRATCVLDLDDVERDLVEQGRHPSLVVVGLRTAQRGTVGQGGREGREGGREGGLERKPSATPSSAPPSPRPHLEKAAPLDPAWVLGRDAPGDVEASVGEPLERGRARLRAVRVAPDVDCLRAEHVAVLRALGHHGALQPRATRRVVGGRACACVAGSVRGGGRGRGGRAAGSGAARRDGATDRAPASGARRARARVVCARVP